MGYNIFSSRGAGQKVSESFDLIFFLHYQAAFCTAGWDRGEHGTSQYNHKITLVSVQICLFFFFFFPEKLARLCHKYLLSLFCLMVLESPELLGLMHGVPSFAFIIINMSNPIYINYLEHVSLGFQPPHCFSLENLRGQRWSNWIL